jgi:hypothetical protein
MRWQCACNRVAILGACFVALAPADDAQAATATQRKMVYEIYNRYLDEISQVPNPFDPSLTDAQRYYAQQNLNDAEERLDQKLKSNGLMSAADMGGLARAPGLAFDILAQTDPWLFYRLDFTNTTPDLDNLFLKVEMPLFPPARENAFFGFLNIELEDTNNDGYVFAGDIPSVPPEESYPLSRVFLGMEGDPDTDFSADAGHNLIAGGLYEFDFEAQIGPQAGEIDTLTLYLNLNLSPGDTIHVTSAVIQTPFLRDGDFDEDGAVAGADFLIWQRELGRSGGDLAADNNRDGRVDGVDLGAWQNNFAGSVAAATATPEPASVALLSLAVAFVVVARPAALRR